MRMDKGVVFLSVGWVVMFMFMFLGGKWVAAAEVHHVVGGDRGWDPTSDLLSWSSGRLFRVGDQIWFTYSVAEGLVAELKSKEEYETCDVSNPIKMYTEGLHTVPLEREGTRYFVSSDTQNCKNGLKLHVQVLPKETRVTNSSPALKLEAPAPTTPSSASSRYGYNTMLMLTLVFCVIIDHAY